jgi:hypothetical protein
MRDIQGSCSGIEFKKVAYRKKDLVERGFESGKRRVGERC